MSPVATTANFADALTAARHRPLALAAEPTPEYDLVADRLHAAMTTAANGGDTRVGLTWAAAVAAERARWVWRDRLPEGAVSLLVGRGGLGKSQTLCHVAACITRGTLPGDRQGQPATVLVASAEDAQAQVLVPRLIAAGADLSRVAFLDGLSLPDEMPGLADRMAETAARLVVVDPLVAFIPSEHNTHRDQHVRRVLAPLAQLAEMHHCSVVGVVHLNKGQDREVLDRVGGSVGLGAAARSVLILGRDPDDEGGERGSRRVLAHAKSNYGRLAPSVSLRIESRDITADDGTVIETSRVVTQGEHSAGASELLSAPSAEERSERDDAREHLEAALANGPRAVQDVLAAARAQGVSRTTLYRARAALRVESVQIGGGGDVKRAAWALPGPTSQAVETASSANGGTQGETQVLEGYVPTHTDVGRRSESPAVEPNTYVPPYVPEREEREGGTEGLEATSHVPPGPHARAHEAGAYGGADDPQTGPSVSPDQFDPRPGGESS